MAAPMLTVQVIALDGEVVLESLVPATQSVLELKEALWRRSKTWAPCWQRLIAEREVTDTEILGDLFEDAVTLQLVVTPDPWDLLISRRAKANPQGKEEECCKTRPPVVYFFDASSQEVRVRKPILRAAPEPGATARQRAAVEAAEAMTAEQSLQLVQRLFEDVEASSSWRAEDVLYFLREDLDGVSATTATGTATSLRAALHDQVIQTLDAPDPNGDFGKIVCVLRWLGAPLVPHLVAWLHLRRPLTPNLRRKVELMRRLSDSARVRLAAKSALADKGDITVARVEELSKLRAALLRDATAAAFDRALLKRRDQVTEKLQSWQSSAATAVVSYAVKRALKR